MQSPECVRLDDTFGPHATNCRGDFDFTLLFEETILSLSPLTILLIIAPLRVLYLFKKNKKVIGSPLLSLKLVSFAAFGALQLVLLVLWVEPSAIKTRATVPTTVVTTVGSLVFSLLSYAEHVRSVQPSFLINIYLFVSLLFDIARTRTLWLRHYSGTNQAIAIVFTATVGVKVAILLLEAVEKRWILRPKYKAYPPEATSGIYNRSFFWWLNSLFRSGFSKLLFVEDLFILDKHLTSEYLQERFHLAWGRGKYMSSTTKKTPNSLLLVSFRLLKWPILRVVPPRACLTALNFCQPFLINRAIKLSEEAVSQKTTNIGYGLIGAYVFVYIGIAISMGQYQHLTYRAITMLRGGLVSMLYQKTTDLSLKDVDPASSMTLMSADIERIVQGWQSMHEIWSNVIEVALAIYLLEKQLGVACAVPIGVALLSMAGSIVAMNFVMSRQAMWLEAIERRISATSVMLASMKGIKMCGLKQTLFDSLQNLRIEELDISKKFRKLLIWNMAFSYLTQVFAPILTFAVFSIIAKRNGGHTTLDTARVFTSLSLFALLAEPLGSLIMSLATFMGSVGCFVRIQEFLEKDTRKDPRKKPADFIEGLSQRSSRTQSLGEKGSIRTKSSALALSFKDNFSSFASHDAISVRGGSFGWDPEKEPLLKNITMNVPRQKLTIVVGPVGCGKSTLLKALLGEVPTLAGTVQISSASVAYCEQTPWHMNESIQQSIIAASGFDEKWYTTVLRACALEQDFKQLPRGDQTIIGSKGAALSGGQSQRIALARAIYAQKEIIIIDDALSGLDASTENHIFHNLLGYDGLLRRLHLTILIASSAAKRLPFADHIISLDMEGNISEQGKFEELDAAGGYASSFNLPLPDWNNKPEEDSSGPQAYSYVPPNRSQTTDGLEAEANRRTGDMSIYLYYINSIGWKPTVIFIVAIIAFIVCISFPNIWVKWWATANMKDPNGRLGYWLGVYVALGCTALLCLIVSCWQMIITMVPRSGERFHYTLLSTVLSAPMSFFSRTDSGVTVNRFSQDLQLIDMELPVAALNTFATFVLCIAQMVLIGVASVYAAIAFPVVLAALYGIQKFYLRTSRQLRFMDLEAKAPLYSQFTECLSGLATIRAFGWQGALQKKNQELLDQSQRPFYLLFAVQRWLTLVLDLVVAAIAVILIVLVVKLRGTVSAGNVGIALLNVITFSQSIKLLITFWTTLETHIGAVARIKIFSEDAVGEDMPTESYMPPPTWPSKGAIEFSHLSAAYKPNEPVLRDISISINAGEKIGVCGRTGSGKSSFVLSIFRMIELSGGTIAVDEIDISSIPRQEIRSRITGVSQDSFLLKGSVRLNADPSGTYSDEAIVSALKSVQLLTVIEEKGGLDTDIDELYLSHGQKQLFCLARAMLRHSTILILDEATSNVDGKTDEIMQRVIREKFSSHTIVAVAHKLDTILDFDKVIVLDFGMVVEFDDPYLLLNTPDSAFAKLYNSTMAEQVEEVALEDDVRTPISLASPRSIPISSAPASPAASTNGNLCREY
ncbi:putative multidrug resistance protein MDR [Glonium stellatum]|uniref:Putative multidrug resistance protein MDR n=1 Tax=Glonium stellatum TaxID=574774 RepID=A0A8E2FBB2_9PEZI|nr:putative multidrug resistance protein MDR [Glonium stellatum]